MAIRDIFRVSWKTYFNPRAWLGVDELKRNNRTIWSILKSIFTTPQSTRVETFEQSLKRQGINEQALKKISNKYLTNAIIFALCAVASFFISFYYLIHHKTFAGWMLCIAGTSLFAVQAFRFHFWYFQIKNRKLGCTLQEWWRGKTEG